MTTDPRYARHRRAAAAANYRGIQSTPLVSRSGEILGVLSTHHREPHRPSERDFRVLDLYARQAADFVERERSAARLREKTKQLEEEDKRKGFFLATLGHELRNPLAALDSAMKVVSEGSRDGTDLLPMMSVQIDHLKRLVNDLLEISRITRGTVILRRARTDLARVTHAAAEAVATSIRAKRQDLVIPAVAGPHIFADEMRLEQVMANLLGNASKYTPEERRIEVLLSREGGDAVIVVRDQGRGLQHEEFERIFEPFAQTDPGSGGLGIGLALVKRLVELHGGTIDVASDGLGLGCSFTVRIPIGDASRAAPIETHLGIQPLPSSARVLIIDDRRDNAEALRLLLETQGAQTLCAFTGSEALEAARSWRPNVMLIDIGLPDIPGYEVARRIRVQNGKHPILLLAVTGFGDPIAEDKAEQLEAFDEWLVKPVDHDRLHELITRHIAAKTS